MNSHETTASALIDDHSEVLAFHQNERAELERLQGEITNAVFALVTERDALLAKLEQIATVCTDNMGRNCNHHMALGFVRQVASDAYAAHVEARS